MLAPILLSLLGLPALGEPSEPLAGARSHEAPRLVVVIVIDQLPAWVIPRVERHFAPGGFRRLMEEGAWFEQAYYPQAATLTGVGHATIATGGFPAGHGIPGNAWYDRTSGREVYCAEDESVQIVGGPADKEPKVSPRLLTSTTFADEQRIASGFRAKTVAISAKDRSAILLAGHTGKAFWYSQRSGLFLSSSFYFLDGKLPRWVEAFNASRPADKFLHKTWNTLLDPAAYAAPPDDRLFETDHKGLGRTFPHLLGRGLQLGPEFYKALSISPQGSELLLDVARAAIAGEQLGTRGVTDILCISLTANDYVGHAFGPESIEYMDMTLQTDRQLERLFAHLDQKIGAGRWMAVLTSDHGSCASPEYLREQGYDVGRVDPEQILSAADAALDEAFGSEDWVAPYYDPGVFFRTDALKRRKVSAPDAQRVAVGAVRRLPGVAEVFPASELAGGKHPPTAIARAAAATIHPERGPDLIIIPKPYWYLSREMRGYAAMHGSPYAYDAHVPLFFHGPGIPAGRHSDRVHITDVAPTISAYLGVPAPSGNEGRSLVGMMRNRWCRHVPQPHGHEEPVRSM